MGIALAIVVAAAALGMYAYRQLQGLEGYRQRIVSQAREVLNRDVHYVHARLDLGFFPALTFEGVKIAEKDGRGSFAAAEAVSFRVALLPYLLDRKLLVKEILLTAPRMQITRDARGIWNIADLFTTTRPLPVELGAIAVAGGEVILDDRTVKSPPLVVKDLELHLDRWERGKTTNFRLEAVCGGAGGAGRTSLTGKLRLAREGEDLVRQSGLEAKLRVRNFDLALPWPWVRPRVPLETLSGVLNADLVFQGGKEEFSSAGSVDIKAAKCFYPQMFPVQVNTESLRCNYELKKTPSTFSFGRMDIALDDLKFRGHLSIQGIDGPDPLWEAGIAGGDLDLERHGKYLPYGLIPAETAAFIRKHIRTGVFRLQAASLKGRRSDFRNWGAANRASIADIRATVTGGSLEFGAHTPRFHNIKGQLLVSEREFRFENMTGNFGDSPLTLNGKIENYALAAPATYPFTAIIQPSRRELAWLLGMDLPERLSLSGTTSVKLAGKGPAASYELQGEWNLKEASYRWGDWLVKPAGRENKAIFSMKIEPRGLSVNAGRYLLPPLDIGGTAFFPFAGSGTPSRIDGRCRAVSLEALRPLSPQLARHEAGGWAEGRLSGVKKGQATAAYLWQGDLVLQKASFRIPEQGGIFRELSGTLRWAGGGISTTGLSGSYGKTPFTLAGTVTDLDNPVYEVNFAAPFVHADDLPLREFPTGNTLREVRGTARYTKNLLRLSDLSFRYQGGHITAAGETHWAAAGIAPSHHYRFSLSGVPVEGLFQALEKDRTLTGNLSGTGDLAVTGQTAADFKKSVAGNLHLKIEKGVIKKFQVLARIFSLLNVSQLLRLKLPDMTAEGMAFRATTVDITLKNGIAATDNFYLDSDAMNIVGTGKIDLVKRTIDATIGLQPLQTIDKVISRIPVAGWILTDDDRRFITVYFEAKGSLDNPAVNFIPIKGLSAEALNIFKRVFKLPKKLVTDTGEIIR